MIRKSTFITVVVFITLFASLLSFTAATVITAQKGQGNLDEESERYRKQIDSMKQDRDAVQSELESAKSAAEAELSELKTQLAALQSKLDSSQSNMSGEIASLQSKIAEKDAEIASLEADIAKYETVYTIDVRSQATLIDSLVEYIDDELPLVQKIVPILDENGNDTGKTEKVWVSTDDVKRETLENYLKAQAESSPDKNLSVTVETDPKTGDYVYPDDYDKLSWQKRDDIIVPQVSVYYEDLSTGYHFGYNENIVYNSASVVKAPFILAVLEQIADDEQRYLDTLQNPNVEREYWDPDDDGTEELKIQWSDPLYELWDSVVLDKSKMMKDGSGKIREMDDGTVFTYYDFISYALQYSDNIAYQQLKNRYGYNALYALCRRVKANTLLSNPANMTALDAGKLFKEMWHFIDENEKYGKLLATPLKKSNYSAIIPYGVSPSVAIHKYGWDTGSYHDAGIVLSGDKPYVLAIFTNYEDGGNEVNAYLSTIARKINALHQNFYKEAN